MAHAFAILDFIEPILLKHASDDVRNHAIDIVKNHTRGYVISCPLHEERALHLVTRSVVNVFFNNKQKSDADIPRKDSVKRFKTRQRALDQ